MKEGILLLNYFTIIFPEKMQIIRDCLI